MLRSFVSAVLFLAAVALASEAGLRLLRADSLQYYYDMKRLHAYNPDYLVGLAPNQKRHIRHHAGLWEGDFTTNSLGYRGSPEPSGKPVIACLGDSLVMGFGVSDEDTFCARLGGLQIGGKTYEAQNLGVDAFGSVGDSKRLAEAAEKLPLAAVLLFVSPNDFTIPETLAAQGIRPDDVVDQERRDHPELLRFFRIQFEATRISYLLHALKLSNEQLTVSRAMRKESIRQQLVGAGFSGFSEGHAGDPPSPGLLRYILTQFYAFKPHAPCSQNAAPAAASASVCPEPVPSEPEYACTDRPSASTLEPLPPITQEAYRSMIELAKKKGFRLIPVFLPVQVEELYCGMHGRHHSLGNYAVRAEAFFKQQGIKSIDLASHVPEICRLPNPRVRDQIIPGDGHLTKSGNVWAAEALKEELKKVGDAF